MAKMIYRDPTKIAILLYVTTVLPIVSDPVFNLWVWPDPQTAGQPPQSAFELTTLQMVLMLLYGIILSIEIYAPLKWVYRICNNAHYFSSQTQRRSPSYATISTLIPIVSFIIPFQALTDAASTFASHDTKRKKNLTNAINHYWIICITLFVFSVFWMVYTLPSIINGPSDTTDSTLDPALNALTYYSYAAYLYMVYSLTNACVKCKELEQHEEPSKSEETI